MTARARATFSPVGTVTLTVQGLYYIISGAWPVVHRSSFDMVTGTHADPKLVIAVGLIAVAVGAALLAAVRQSFVPRTTWMVAVGAAMAFMVVDIWYVAGVVIPRMYVADAIAQGAFIVGALIGRRESA